jgi:glucose/arabinose dehydrogenase
MKKVIIFLAVLVPALLLATYLDYRSTSEIAQNSGSPPNTSLLQNTSTTVKLKTGHTFSLTHPNSFSVTVAAEGYKRLRFMAMSPDNRLFVGEMFNANDSRLGHVYIFDNFDAHSKKFTGVHTYLSNLRNPHSIAFYTDKQNKTWLYIALTDKLIRYPYTHGDNAPTTKPQTVATFPAYGQTVKQGGWHLTRTIVVHNDKLYVSVGSSCNSCEEKANEPSRGSILVMNPDGSDQTVFASGLRNAVGLTFVDNALIATNNNADHLGNDRPADTLYEIVEGKNYGWPYCYEVTKKIFPDLSQPWKKNFDCRTVPLADVELPPHSAPLGVAYFDNHLFVALHGSGDAKLQVGYKIITTDARGNQTDFLTGFQQGETVLGRPTGILVNDTKSFFVTDDFNGTIYYVEKKIIFTSAAARRLFCTAIIDKLAEFLYTPPLSPKHTEVTHGRRHGT